MVPNWRNSETSRCTPGARCTVQYLNRAAFALVPVSPTSNIAIRPGNLGNGAVRGPGSWSGDLSLSKNFRLQERLSLQVRADMFNALNKVNLGGPATGANTPTFGEINGAGGMRVIQFNGRLRW